MDKRHGAPSSVSHLLNCFVLVGGGIFVPSYAFVFSGSALDFSVLVLLALLVVLTAIQYYRDYSQLAAIGIAGSICGLAIGLLRMF